MRYNSILLVLVFLLTAVFITTLHADEPGSIVVWGSYNDKLFDIPTPNRDFVAISAGYDHCLALKADGSIVAWGNNNRSIFNTYGTGKCDVPQENTGFVAIAAGGDRSLGLKADGSIVAWGPDIWGEDEILSEHTDFIDISAGTSMHCIGLKANGSIVTWGDMWIMAFLGVVPEPNSGFVSVTAGFENNYALRADGSIEAWGFRVRHGECDVPEPNTDFVAVAHSVDHCLGLKSDGSIVAWGSNEFGQCDLPAPNSDFTAIAAGWYHHLGLKTDGSIVAWGQNDVGECNVPSPNSGFIAIDAGFGFSMGLKSGTTETGSLQVTIEPQEAIDAEAQWRRVGTQIWYNNGYTETNVPVGECTVEFKDISGWIKPENLSVNILTNQITQTFGTYTTQSNTIDIISATWSTAFCYDGESVRMIVQVEGLDGSDVTFEIYEMDSYEFPGEDDDYVTTINGGTVKNNSVVAYWRADWQQDGFLGLLNPPEFYFKVNIADLSLDSDLLTVDERKAKVIRPMIGLPVILEKGMSFEIEIVSEATPLDMDNTAIMISEDLLSDQNEIFLEIVEPILLGNIWSVIAHIPDDISVGLYDLKVDIDGMELIRPNAVSVISEFKTNPLICHITDVHMDFSPMGWPLDTDYTNMDYEKAYTATIEMSCDPNDPNNPKNPDEMDDYDNYVEIYGTNWMERTLCFSKYLTDAEKNGVDFILIGGDNVDWSTDENWRYFYDTLKDSKVPTYVQVGNHDYRDSLNDLSFLLPTFNDSALEFFWDNICSREHFMNYSFDYGEIVHVIGLNSGPDRISMSEEMGIDIIEIILGNEYEDYINEIVEYFQNFYWVQGQGLTSEQMTWLKDNLRESRSNLIFMHHPVYAGDVGPLYDDAVISNFAEFREFCRISKNNNKDIVGVFSGHTHTDEIWYDGYTTYIISDQMCLLPLSYFTDSIPVE